MKFLKLIFFTVFILMIAQVVTAEELLTKNYKIVVNSKCSEGNVTCDNVTYVGINRKTGKSIKLKGSTWHTLCADGVTPCRFQGYIFKNGNVTYFVHQDGYLKVTQNNKVLLEEKGEWK